MKLSKLKNQPFVYSNCWWDKVSKQVRTQVWNRLSFQVMSQVRGFVYDTVNPYIQNIILTNQVYPKILDQVNETK